MKLLGIIGKPLDTVLAPKIFNTLFKKKGLPYRYLPFQVEKPHLKNLILCMKLVDVVGLNVTLPYKESVLPFLDALDVSAKECGAVNTIVRKKNRFIGYNTDGKGFCLALKAQKGFKIQNKRATLIGSGGAARAIAAALATAGAKSICLLNRHPNRAIKAATFFKKRFPKTKWQGLPLNAKNCRRIFQETDLLVQTTSTLPNLPLIHLPKKCLVSDVCYRERRLLFKAKKRGLNTLDGLWMLVHQASLNHQLWTGKKVDPAELRKWAGKI